MSYFEGHRGAADTLRFNEEKLGIGSWRCDAATGQMHWSRGFYELFGLCPSKVVPSYAEIEQRIHPDDRRPRRDFSELLLDRSLLEGEFRVIRPNGTLRWIYNQAEILLDMAGERVCVVGVAIDITRQRESVQPLRAAAERYNALVQVVEGLLWIASSDGRITALANLKATKQDAPDLFYGRGWVDLLHEEDRDAALESWSVSAQTGRPYKVEHRLRQPDGTYRWFRCIAVPVLNADGSAQEWIGISTDVHHEKFVSLPTPSSRLTGAQMRAARGILNWSVKQLAERTKISPSAIRRFEEYDSTPPMHDESVEILQNTFSDAGIEFFFPQVGKPGLRPR
ncbi:PAS domain S-box-containing protein [Nitrobacteraceae bacterium AZCC 2146]